MSQDILEEKEASVQSLEAARRKLTYDDDGFFNLGWKFHAAWFIGSFVVLFVLFRIVEQIIEIPKDSWLVNAVALCVWPGGWILAAFLTINARKRTHAAEIYSAEAQLEEARVELARIKRRVGT